MHKIRNAHSALRLAILLGVAPLALMPAPALAQPAVRTTLDIKAQSLSAALMQLGRQTQVEIIFSPELVRGKRAPALTGSYTIEEAIERLISGQPLRVRRSPGGGFVIEGRSTPVSEVRIQDEDPTPAPTPPVEEAREEQAIIVTGTLLRGVAPTGTNVVGVSRDDVVASGAASANDVLASIPQVGNFGSVPSGSASFAIPIVRPNIRDLGASGGTTTLVLMNGRRLVGSGVLQTTVDPSIIPPEMIERVEIVPDGGSAIYGSDAIGGVINFITRKRFDGIAANVRAGIADDYRSVDGNLTVGKSWTGGSIFLSYAYAWHDNILGIDRDYVTADHTARGGSDFRASTCSPGNFTANNVNYAAPGFVANTRNLCDSTDYADIYPREERHSVFGGLTQSLNDSIDFQTTVYWSRRDTETQSATPGFTGTMLFTNPYFKPLGGQLVQSVAIDFSDVFGKSMPSRSRFDSWGVSPSLTFDLGGNWQLRTEANYGSSYNVVRESTINSTAATLALGGTTTATALNPYDPGATSPAVLEAIRDFENYGQADQEMLQTRAVLDGTLAHLPGGDVRLAVGAEYYREALDSVISLDKHAVFTSAVRSSTSRHVKSLFAETLVPIVGSDNAMPGLRAFQISGSIRYDDYNDVGGTTNPKVGFNYKPIDDLTIRGNYGTSFHAPSLADTTSTADARVQILLFSPFRAATSSPLDLLRPSLFLAGGNPNLKPEKAKTWSLGFDWKPQAIPGLVASLTYYNVRFTDAISVPPVTSPVLFSDSNYASYYIINPTLAQVKAIVGNTPLNGAPSLESLYVGTSPYLVADARRTNLGAVNVDGLDFNLAYARKTGFGSLNASFAGTYTLDRKSASVAGGPFSDNLKNGYGRLNFVAALGGSVGDLTLRASLNHRDGYPILGIPAQSRVSAFNTVDLFLAYDLSGLIKNTMLTLNVDNLLDQDPPYLNSSTGYTNGSTLGRFVSLGVRTKF
ncbi:MAG: TonB-dependent receptor [Novosphingobium sp.]|nr:TonB-dependent receptor [Novosphingobium sp.]